MKGEGGYRGERRVREGGKSRIERGIQGREK